MDILLPRFAAKQPESISLIRGVLMAVLEDDDSYATWSSSSNNYYDRVAKQIEADDHALALNIKSIAREIRAKYRTHIEHELHVHEVPVHRQIDAAVTSALDDNCCVCLQSLKSYKKVVRLRSRDSESSCGHFLHSECMTRLKPSETGHVSCPMCRANLGRPPIHTWCDMERAAPRF
jgi:hypothetical protein